ncbi:hypothetical protein VDP18_22170 [Xanthomonas campestris pv. campestris]|nr:hypothetical protein [Xanthomonas campestris]MEA0676430.1 hypothetical protein [Xanthomonas campestris pv. campestris]MEA0875275.1 hypothetical protein [Xanthomonas campestris pv. campestris]MEB1161993.1 hypothetical protein [Xanthomonas campestris pv. campestris]
MTAITISTQPIRTRPMINKVVFVAFAIEDVALRDMIKGQSL